MKMCHIVVTNGSDGSQVLTQNNCCKAGLGNLISTEVLTLGMLEVIKSLGHHYRTQPVCLSLLSSHILFCCMQYADIPENGKRLVQIQKSKHVFQKFRGLRVKY